MWHTHAMARPPRNELAAAELGKRTSELAAKHPDRPNPKAIERWLIRNHDLDVSLESIRKAHAGLMDPTTCDADLLFGLMAFYGVSPDELGRFAAGRMGTILNMAGATASGPDSGGDLGIRPTGRKVDTALALVA